MAGIEQIKELVKNHQVPKVLGLGGSEQALINEALITLRATFLAESNASLNHHRYTIGENLPDSWLLEAKTIPFLASSRLIEIHDAEKLNANNINDILVYMSNPADFSIIVLVFSKIDKRSKIISALEQQKALFEFSALTNTEILSTIKNFAKAYNIIINTNTINFLMMLLDNDLMAIKEALKKLSLAHENQEISIEHISQQIISNTTADVFKLARFISEGDLKESLYGLGLLRQSQENAIKFLAVLMWQFRVLLHIRHCLDRAMNEWDIRKEVAVYGDRFNWMLKIAKKRTLTFHSNRLTRLLQCDIALKSQKIAEPLTLIEKVVYQSVVGA